MMKTGMMAVVVPMLLAGCATPAELKRPPAQPTLAQPVPLPELKPYQAPIPHAAPRSDRGGTP